MTFSPICVSDMRASFDFEIAIETFAFFQILIVTQIARHRIVELPAVDRYVPFFGSIHRQCDKRLSIAISKLDMQAFVFVLEIPCIDDPCSPLSQRILFSQFEVETTFDAHLAVWFRWHYPKPIPPAKMSIFKFKNARRCRKKT